MTVPERQTVLKQTAQRIQVSQRLRESRRRGAAHLDGDSRLAHATAAEHDELVLLALNEDLLPALGAELGSRDLLLTFRTRDLAHVDGPTVEANNARNQVAPARDLAGCRSGSATAPGHAVPSSALA
jgi:hypothetical protein